MRRTLSAVKTGLLASLVALTACTASQEAAVERPIVGFVLVGAADDLGYNEAIASGAADVARTFPDLRVEVVENVPETAAAGDAMEQLIADGAEVLFATSFGYRDEAIAVARAHPDVVVLHQGGAAADGVLDNFGTYWGFHHEVMFAAGIAAGHATEVGRVGFVAAFPISSAFANIDALALGAQQARPDVSVLVEFTEDWCDAEAQDAAFDRLVEDQVDVLAIHQDCTRRLLARAEAEDIAVVGYHEDGSEVAPESWLVGAVWQWTPVFEDIIDVWLAGDFVGSEYHDGFRGTLVGGDTPAVLTELSARVSTAARQQIETALRGFARGEHTPFDGPLVDRDGVERVPAGSSLDIQDIEALDWYVDGVLVAEPG